MTNLRYFTDKGLNFIHQNMFEFYEEMKKHGNETKWISEFCGKDPTTKSPWNFDFEFEMNALNPNEGDFNNAVRLYELFKSNNIGDAVIYSEKFLSGFLLTYGYEYFVWETKLEAETRVSATFFFDGRKGFRQAIARHTISRLYKLVSQTVDEEADDKYKMTRFVFMNPALRRMVYYPNMDGINAAKGYICGFMKWKAENDNNQITVKLMDNIRLWYSAFCHANLVDAMTIEEISDLVLERIHYYRNDRKQIIKG